jgi:hypothetical protein
MEKNKDGTSSDNHNPVKKDFTCLITLDRIIDLEAEIVEQRKEIKSLQEAVFNCVGKITRIEELLIPIQSNLKNILSTSQRREAIRRNLGSGY